MKKEVRRKIFRYLPVVIVIFLVGVFVIVNYSLGNFEKESSLSPQIDESEQGRFRTVSFVKDGKVVNYAYPITSNQEIREGIFPYGMNSLISDFLDDEIIYDARLEELKFDGYIVRLKKEAVGERKVELEKNNFRGDLQASSSIKEMK